MFQIFENTRRRIRKRAKASNLTILRKTATNNKDKENEGKFEEVELKAKPNNDQQAMTQVKLESNSETKMGNNMVRVQVVDGSKASNSPQTADMNSEPKRLQLIKAVFHKVGMLKITKHCIRIFFYYLLD